jgi:hypothetical protein
MGRTFPVAVTVVGVLALIVSLVVFRPAPGEAPVVEVEPDRLSSDAVALPPGVVDATGSGIIFRNPFGVGLTIELVPDPPEGEGLQLTTRGPLAPEQLDAIRDSRPEEDLIHVYAYDPTLPSQAPQGRPGDIVVHQFTPEDGWQTLPRNRPVIRRRLAPPPPPFRGLPLD